MEHFATWITVSLFRKDIKHCISFIDFWTWEYVTAYDAY